jgi:hypothetical protein
MIYASEALTNLGNRARAAYPLSQPSPWTRAIRSLARSVRARNHSAGGGPSSATARRRCVPGGRDADINEGDVSGVSTSDAARIKAARARKPYLNRANEFLKQVASFYAVLVRQDNN